MTVVNEIPPLTREKKYPLSEWFDGQTHRLVQGDEFTAKETSFKTYLYKQASEVFGVKVAVKWRTEDGKRVAYVVKVADKAPAKPTKAPAKRKPAKSRKA